MLFDLPVCANDAETGAGERLLSVHFGSSSVRVYVVLGVEGKLVWPSVTSDGFS